MKSENGSDQDQLSLNKLTPAKRRVSHVEQELFSLPEHMKFQPIGGRVCVSNSYVCLLVIFMHCVVSLVLTYEF